MSTAPFDIGGEALLSNKAINLTESELDAHTRMAEMLLGVHDTSFSGVADTRIKIALSMQVNFQLEQGVEAAVYDETHDGDLWSIYAARVTDPRALVLATKLLTEANATSTLSPVTSLR